MTAVNPLPNILTWLRLVAGVVLFALLASAVGAVPFADHIPPDMQETFAVLAFITFVVGAVTDWFDGWLARKLNATTDWGATFDPIADKILVCGTILGLASLGQQPHIVVPGALILFREFAVSSLRESSASRGIKLPVTLLAKWKTTLQLLALGLELFAYVWPFLGLPDDPAVRGPVTNLAHVLMWVAAAVSLWTGWGYFHAARLKISHER
ncbi:CDP-diacylglycerol--glycerol-3-phosphate 3-phosphatidyltransferase [Caulobacter sp. 17J80-11]|uniref:CDP-diacylglycerol--glycerol-3-phosphate 3-phosphatidyltransferase n=1 Tax=Caulobacter sp. 17J80-11 TaxID=2763502 RepID=UPI001CA45575|nr:CDP-diacylglycerol--glycerol-3-phosphate 3-phosphatidyltransferase [Caulobacter sp. 17J80-11]